MIKALSLTVSYWIEKVGVQEYIIEIICIKNVLMFLAKVWYFKYFFVALS